MWHGYGSADLHIGAEPLFTNTVFLCCCPRASQLQSSYVPTVFHLLPNCFPFLSMCFATAILLSQYISVVSSQLLSKCASAGLHLISN